MGRGGQSKRVTSDGTDGCGEICQSEHHPGNAYAHAGHGSHSNAIARLCANRRPNADSYTSAGSNARPNRHSDSGAHRHAGPAYAYGCAYSYAYSYGHTDAYGDAHAYAYSYTDAVALLRAHCVWIRKGRE